VKPSDRQEVFRRASSSNTTWSRHIASKLSSCRRIRRTLSSIQGFNLRGAVPNLALKLNAAPGAPLEKQTAAKAPESARRRGEVWQATSHMVVYRGDRVPAFVRGVQVGQSIPRAPPCLRRIGSCLTSMCGVRPGNVVVQWIDAQDWHWVWPAHLPTPETRS